MTIHIFFSFNICNLSIAMNVLRKMASCCLRHTFELEVVVMLDWLPPKAKQPILRCYFSHSLQKSCIQAFCSTLVRSKGNGFDQKLNSPRRFHIPLVTILRYPHVQLICMFSFKNQLKNVFL